MEASPSIAIGYYPTLSQEKQSKPRSSASAGLVSINHIWKTIMAFSYELAHEVDSYHMDLLTTDTPSDRTHFVLAEAERNIEDCIADDFANLTNYVPF